MTSIRKVVKLHAAQAAFRHSKALWRGFIGGRGSGKTWVGALDLICRARPGRTYLACGPTYAMLSDSSLRSFLTLARDLDLLDPGRIKKGAPPEITLATGAEILFRSADDPERLRGPNYSGAWLDEASQMSQDAFDVIIASLRQAGEQGWLSATMTPRGLSHWTYEKWGQNPPAPDTAIFHARTRDNPFLPVDFQHKIALQYTGPRALQELDGRFTNIEGAEWPAEYFDGILFDAWPPDLTHRVLALDPSKGKADRSGDYSAFVLLGLDREWVLWADADLDNSRPVESPRGGKSLVEDGLHLARAWQPDAFVVETNGFQELVAAALLRVAAERAQHLPLYGTCSTSPKIGRIRVLGTYLAQGRLRIRNTPGGRLLTQQMRDFPLADHDDGPDSLQLGIRMMELLLSGRVEGKREQPQPFGA